MPDNKDIINLLNLPLNKFTIEIRKLNNDSIKLIVNSLKLEDVEKLKVIFLNADEETKKILLSNDDYFKTLITATNRFNKNSFYYLSNKLKGYVLSRKNLIDSIDTNLYKDLVSQLDDNEIEDVYNNINTDILNLNINDILTYINNNFKINNEMASQLAYKCVNNNNFLWLYKINNDIQLMIYFKFEIFIQIEKEDNNAIIDNFNIPIELLENINTKHIKALLNKLIQKENIIDNTQAFLIVFKLYCTFGFDNTAKIIDDKFSYMNELAIKRAALVNFIDERRQYRLENQHLFYSNDMIAAAKEAIKKRDLMFFKKISDIKSPEEIINLFHDLENKMTGNEMSDNHFISFCLKTIIDERETTAKNEYLRNYLNGFVATYGFKNNSVSLKILYDKFKDIEIRNTKLDDDGRPILNKDLNDFLFGNYKSNNDCILRLVLNNQALGLNDTISTIINCFPKIKRIMDRSNGKLSINSILDIIDVFKVLFYKLEPNEQDMTLETISKIMRSTKYCSEPKEEIFRRARKLHVERRKKNYASIPSINGICNNGVSYKVLEFDNPNLITLGIDTGSCLKIGGKGEDFLNYILTSPHSIVIKFDYNGKAYICPFIRNGNAIYGNGIDPEPEDDIYPKLIEALHECGNKIIDMSSPNEKIEFLTITDLHKPDFFKGKNYPKIDINSYLPIDSNFYSDYHKKEITNYIISSENQNVKAKFYVPCCRYYQKRSENYIYNPDIDTDQERIELQINSINYDLIDCMNCDEKEKNSLKRKYNNVKIQDFDYIIGNKDWFIAVNELNVLSGCLPYDKRAREEYHIALRDIKDIYDKDLTVIKK